MAEQMTNRARLESETYTKLHEVMKQKSGGSADSIYPKLKAFSRFAQDMVTDVRASAARSPGMVLCCSIAAGVMAWFCGVMALLKTLRFFHLTGGN